MHILIAGCGWLGSAVARKLLARGDRVTGIRSDPERAEQLRSLGITPLVLDLADPESARHIPADVEVILALQAAQGDGEDAYRKAYLTANRTLLEAARARSIQAFVYSGSTGLFGQTDGSDVVEVTPPQPTTPTGIILWEAEKAILAAANQGLPTRIVRLSGLYGPGRTWLIDRVRRGLMTLGQGDEAWMNSCHQEDAVNTLLAALDHGRHGAIYHATDTLPMRRREVITFIAERLGLQVVPSRATVGYKAPNRRILGEATRQELQIHCRWRSLREGLAPFF